VVRLLQYRGWRFDELRLRNVATMLGRRAWDCWQLWTKSVPVLAAINSVNEAPEALNDYGFRKSSGGFAIFTAIRRTSSLTQCEVQKVRRPYSGAAGLSFPVAARLRLAAATGFVSR
jgi:hypothetical protein